MLWRTLQAIALELGAIFVAWVRTRPLLGLALAVCGAVVAFRTLLLLAGILFAGTSASTTDVSGVLSCDGTKVEEGTVQFLPKGTGQPASARISKGRFTARNVAIGANRVLCFAVKETGKTVNEGGHSFPERISVIPDAYRDGVDVTIEPRNGELVLDWRSR